MKKLTILLSAAVAVVSFSAVAEYVVVWQAGETPATVADGHVALTYDANNAITSMSAASDQLKQIRVNGVRARLTDNGCLRPDLDLMLLIR